ncbi:hypothetical protein [Methylophilus sp. 14]|uniref:hypothetical protein n=1 Tax=Methylophilus sp. 14 TaxID=2781019 RepID=UPI00188E302E|nr:hypothetical protein [Methylophilus sp. 14]MBF4988534.1 hypothetical protein [Methylophilus sp. 14]
MKDKKSRIQSVLFWIFNRLKELVRFLVDGFWWPPLALILAALYWYLIANSIPTPHEPTVEQYGVYGDSFGRLTSIFTALGFGGLIITLLLQQRQIRSQEKSINHSRKNEEKGRYEEILFKLLDIYRQTLSEVQVGETIGRSVLRKALDRVDAGLLDDGVNCMPRDLQGKWDKGRLQDSDRQRIDYLHYRNFKIVATEIHLQARLVDTFEVLLEHMLRGAPNHLLITAYKDLVFSQITFIECRYFFLVALSHPSRVRLRELMASTGFLDRISRSQIHLLHRQMYKEYWNQDLTLRETPPSIPMSAAKIKLAFRAQKAAGGAPKTTYKPLSTR